MRLPTSPWECVMFQTGAHAILSTRGNAHVSLHQRNWQFRQMHSVARYIQTEKIVLHTCHSRLATTNYIIFKGVNHPFFPLKSIYNVSKVAKTIRNFVWKFSIMWLIKQNQRKHYAFNANNKLCISYWNWTSLVPSHFPPNLFFANWNMCIRLWVFQVCEGYAWCILQNTLNEGCLQGSFTLRWPSTVLDDMAAEIWSFIGHSLPI